MPPRCLIVDDNASFLAASSALLQRQGMSVLGMATTTSEALQLTAELRPDVVLVDIDLGTESGFDLARQIGDGTAGTGPVVILISTHLEDDFSDLIADSPALGFLAKQELSRRAIEQLLDGPATARAGWRRAAVDHIFDIQEAILASRSCETHEDDGEEWEQAS
jgi:DNA-binding NarL/FixJ family response regulator